jgi:hypothetical protein
MLLSTPFWMSISHDTSPGSAEKAMVMPAQSRLDTTHPPTVYRVGFLQAHRVAQPKVTLGADDAARLDRELAVFETEMQQKLVGKYIDSLYHA